MKKIVFIFYIFLYHSLSAQITLKECIDAGLANKANIKSAKTETLIANLKTLESKAKFLPQISLAYDYRYNPIIPTQIVPVGQFAPIPTEETRGIQFGTNWQQNAGVTVYQPIIDLAIKSRIKESNLSEAIANIDLKKAEDDLKFEIVKTYSRVVTFGFQVEETLADTLRSFQSYQILKNKFQEGKVLKTELNKALVNHNANLTNHKKASSALISEKIYLHYLTNLALERILEASFSPIPASVLEENAKLEFTIENLPDFQKLSARENLINQQIRTEKTKYSPTVGFQGYLGANQFSQDFAPFKSNSWFGNSYVGLAVKLPIFSPDKSINADKQLQSQLVIVNHQKEELKSQKSKELLQTNLEVERLQAEIGFAKNSLALLQENIKVYQERLQDGQFAASELNVQEAELQKLATQIKQLNEQLNKALVERLYITGKLSEKLQNL